MKGFLIGTRFGVLFAALFSFAIEASGGFRSTWQGLALLGVFWAACLAWFILGMKYDIEARPRCNAVSPVDGGRCFKSAPHRNRPHHARATGEQAHAGILNQWWGGS